MKKWSRLTALMLAFVIMFSTVSGALAAVEVDYEALMQWIQSVKEANGLGDVIWLDRGGKVIFESDSFVPSDWPLYTEEIGKELAFAEGEQEIALKSYGKVELIAPSAGQWQVYAANTWVDVKGETGSTFAVTFAKVQSLIADSGIAKIRCEVGDSVTETAVMVMDYSDSVAVMPAMAENGGMAYSVSKAANNDVMLAAEEGSETSYTVRVDYVMQEDYTTAAESWIATVGKKTDGTPSTLSQTYALPYVKGYEPYLPDSVDQIEGVDLIVENNVPKLKLELTVTSSMVLQVLYRPANVAYKVNHYWQNVNDDGYTLKEVTPGTALTHSTIGEVAKSYTGFYALLYDHPTVAADGSTVVDVYYDRHYYLMNFDLVNDGAYGTEPIYARYGADIDGIPVPYCAGYTFKGWSLNGTDIEAVPTTMPAGNTTYKAVWEMGDSAKVTIVFWGENADDENYSYLHSQEIQVKPGTEFTYSESGMLICGQEPHTHSEACEYNCGKTEHTHSIDNGCYELTCTKTVHSHSDACYDSCTIENHNHTTACYNNVGSRVDSWATRLFPNNPREGQIYDAPWGSNYVYIDGSWYNYSGSTNVNTAPTKCGKTENDHVHDDSCLGCGLTPHVHSNDECYELTCTTEAHSHSSACGYKCGKNEHTHGSNCYLSGAGLDTNKWLFEKSDTVTVAPDGSTVVNVYYTRKTYTITFKSGGYNSQTIYTITEKWGADLSSHWPIKGTNGTTYDDGQRWTPSGSTEYTQVLVYVAVMPADDFTLTLSVQNYDTFIMHYMVEALPGTQNTVAYQGKNFIESFKVTAKYNHVTKAEDFFNLDGFTQWTSNPQFNNNGSLDINGGGNVYFYYTRNNYEIVFNDGYDEVLTDDVPYQMPLDDFEEFIPDPPVGSDGKPIYAPGSVEFGGWYQNSETSGKEFVLSDHTMPSNKLQLYAKWVPVEHTVEFYLDEQKIADGEKLYDDVNVLHGKKVTPVPAEPENDPYEFVGWFYRDAAGEEKAFDFETMPITHDMQVYGKWSSNVLLEYEIRFELDDANGTPVADPITGSILAGQSRTFYAKGGTELYDAYKEGYFPDTKSHNLEALIENDEDGDGKLVFTFKYSARDAVPYTVRYLLADETGEAPAEDEDGNYISLLPDKVVSDNKKAVVTENFEPVPNHMPDEYQKELVVSIEPGAKNEIIFLYVEDLNHALYLKSHYVEPVAEGIAPENWIERLEFREQGTGDVGSIQTIESETIPGFALDKTVEGTLESDTLTTDGLHLKLFYKRLSYPYRVEYLEEGTNREVHAPKNSAGRYEDNITEDAVELDNYELVSAEQQNIQIRIEEGDTAVNNVITFYYKEKLATINYVAHDPDCNPMESGHKAGYVTFSSETLGVETGTITGSTAVLTGAPTYKFVGWFLDEDCTQPVPEDWVDGDNKIVPQKPEGSKIWVAATYYAKFDWNVADLTITKSNLTATNGTDSAIFKVTGYTADSAEQKTWYVSLANNGTAVIKDLQITKPYTVTEMESWSVYYAKTAVQEGTIKAGSNLVEFENEPLTDKWLHDESYEVNFDD